MRKRNYFKIWVRYRIFIFRIFLGGMCCSDLNFWILRWKYIFSTETKITVIDIEILNISSENVVQAHRFCLKLCVPRVCLSFSWLLVSFFLPAADAGSCSGLAAAAGLYHLTDWTIRFLESRFMNLCQHNSSKTKDTYFIIDPFWSNFFHHAISVNTSPTPPPYTHRCTFLLWLPHSESLKSFFSLKTTQKWLTCMEMRKLHPQRRRHTDGTTWGHPQTASVDSWHA